MARLYVDTDRDGKITTGDDLDRDKWSTARGAVFAYNNDDDAGNHTQDCTDSVVNGTADERTMTRVVIGKLTGTATSAKFSFAPTSAPVRVFAKQSTGWVKVLAPGTASINVNVAAIQAQAFELLVEATGPRTKTWDGTITLTLDVTGTTSSSDTIKLRCAPLIYTDNTRPAERVYAMRIASDNLPFWNALQSGLSAQGVPLQDCDQYKYGKDRWVQDGMQLGYQGYVGANGPTWLYDFNQLERGKGGGLWNLVPKELLAPNQGMSYGGAGQAEACNFGGNLEVIPPHTDGKGKTWAFGRLYNGGGNKGSATGQPDIRHMNKEEVDHLNAQGVQGPVLEISTEWLAVGHVDEISAVVRDYNKVNGRPWKILWASPALARKALKDLKNSGQGSLKVFAGRSTQTTVSAILADTKLMAFNDQIQARLDSNKTILMDACKLTAADFVEVPVYYEVSAYGGIDYAVSQNPGVQNCIPVNDRLYVPDPEGPIDPQTQKDVWKVQVTDAVAPLGLKVTFVDVFNSYHLLMGEAHCGSNVMYKPYDDPWWSK